MPPVPVRGRGRPGALLQARRRVRGAAPLDEEGTQGAVVQAVQVQQEERARAGLVAITSARVTKVTERERVAVAAIAASTTTQQE